MIAAPTVMHAMLVSAPSQIEPRTRILDLATGSQAVATQTIEYWFDAARKQLRLVIRTPGQPTADVVRTDPPASPIVDALAALDEGATLAVASGAARAAGSGTIDGRPVRWLSLALGGARERAAFEAGSGRLVAISVGSLSWRVRLDAAVARTRAQFTSITPTASAGSGGHIAAGRTISAGYAQHVTGWNPVWLGRSFGGRTLLRVQTMRLQESHGAGPQLKTGLLLSYYSKAAGMISLQEAPRPHLVAGYLPKELLPASGRAVLTSSASGCSAQLAVSGVWVTLMASGSRSCAAEARALRPYAPP
ncbi:MAG TPA: hypothetical protein VGF46_12380, partial [Gaiellales bacterium]